MPVPPDVMKLLLLVPMAAFIMYYDVRYRRIPNVLVAEPPHWWAHYQYQFWRIRWCADESRRDSLSLSCRCF